MGDGKLSSALRRNFFILAVGATTWAAGLRIIDAPLGLDAFMPVPEDNPLTRDKIALGRRLFFDRRLSRDRTLSCASCHDPKRAFSDGRPVALGIDGKKGNRSAPALINRGYGSSHFWDGRAPTLEKQVLEPIFSPIELALSPQELEARFRMPASDIARALASYVRTIRSGSSAFDRYLDGDSKALSHEARRGLDVFRGKANCTACHVGPNFTDERSGSRRIQNPDAARDCPYRSLHARRQPRYFGRCRRILLGRRAPECTP
ncbi:MAG: cytochrome-c peroxidase [Bryobacterales bacterium]|nr:cytochrome-c peroxidase [Bryobacterales bacterium]